MRLPEDVLLVVREKPNFKFGFERRAMLGGKSRRRIHGDGRTELRCPFVVFAFIVEQI